jgi:hypothetical protein
MQEIVDSALFMHLGHWMRLKLVEAQMKINMKRLDFLLTILIFTLFNINVR